MFVLVKLLGLVLISTASSNGKMLTNIDFIGLGYDIAYGNPHSDKYDPGFRQPVFQLSYDDKSMSSDHKWILPDKISALQVIGCSYEMEMQEITTMNSYQDMLSAEAKVQGGGWDFKFSASPGYEIVNTGLSKSNSVYLESAAKCTHYQASVKSNSGISVSHGFHRSVQLLPTHPSDEQYFNFIRDYGTHYVTQMLMGAKVVMRSEFTSHNHAQMKRRNFSLKLAASYSFRGLFTGSVSTLTSSQNAIKSEFEENRSSCKISYLGSLPSSDGKWETWAKTTGESPYPIEYTLHPIDGLLTPEYFSTISSADIALKKQLLARAFKHYCRNPGCKRPRLDSVSIQMNMNGNIIKGREYQSCRPDYHLLSCGISNSKAASTVQSSYSSYAYPVGWPKIQCVCYDQYGANCTAWCTNIRNGFEIMEASGAYFIDVQCSTGKKVIGCYSRPLWGGITHAFQLWEHYPLSDGNGCLCGSYGNSTCIAACASDVDSHEVRHGYGSGKIKVQCSPHNFVLGCGMKSDGIVFKGKPEVVVDSQTSCECRHQEGVTCYAICGMPREPVKFEQTSPAAATEEDSENDEAYLGLSYNAGEILIGHVLLCVAVGIVVVALVRL